MKHRPRKLVGLEVTREDIENMLERYDSGMADLTTANAVCRALERKLQPGYHPRIHSAARHHGCRLSIGENYFSLPSEVYWWLDRANKGGSVHPVNFVIVLPEDFLRLEEPAINATEATIAA